MLYVYFMKNYQLSNTLFGALLLLCTAMLLVGAGFYMAHVSKEEDKATKQTVYQGKTLLVLPARASTETINAKGKAFCKNQGFVPATDKQRGRANWTYVTCQNNGKNQTRTSTETMVPINSRKTTLKEIESRSSDGCGNKGYTITIAAGYLAAICGNEPTK